MPFTLGAQLAQTKSTRASVLPYVIKNDGNQRKIYFLFGIDRETGDITDLGGGVKRDEFSLEAGLREFREESDEIFGTIYSFHWLLNGTARLYLFLKNEKHTRSPQMEMERKRVTVRLRD